MMGVEQSCLPCSTRPFTEMAASTLLCDILMPTAQRGPHKATAVQEDPVLTLRSI